MAAEKLACFWSILNRKKTVADDYQETPLNRCLNTFDITLLGIGQMVGAGIYVLTGTVVKDLAGPSVVLSYLFAGIAAILSALCYAEFGARFPKAGSAYSYVYVTIGEFWGFIIGWNIVLEHLLGASAVGRAWSGALDSLFSGAIKNGTITYIGYLSRDSVWLSEYPDFIAFAVCLAIFLIICTGAKFTMNFNSVFTIINIIVIVFLVCTGFYFADEKNWSDPKHGGFFPYGFGGTLSGAATCFFAYIGFEGIAVSGEEVKRPEKSIPIATVLSLTIVTFMYVLVTISLTLMVPYYQVEPSAAFPMAFATRGVVWAEYIVAIGTLFGITTALVGSAYSLPRAIYSMASDGLLFRIFAYVHPKTQTPIWGIMTFGMLASLMSLLFEIETLVEFMSIGTLLAYTIVAACVIILRYMPVNKCQFQLKPEEQPDEDVQPSEESSIIKKSKSHDDFGKLKDKLKALPFLGNLEPGNAAILATLLMIGSIVCFNSTLIFGFPLLESATWWTILVLVFFGAVIILCYLIMIAHEKNDAFVTFQIPLVPLIPTLSMFCNIALMMKLSYLTWIRLAIWLGVGLLVYFCYGMWNSLENRSITKYGQVVAYAGDASVSCSTISKLDEEIHEQQPVAHDDHEGLGEM